MNAKSHGCLDELIVEIMIHDIDNLLESDFRRRYSVCYLCEDIMESVKDRPGGESLESFWLNGAVVLDSLDHRLTDTVTHAAVALLSCNENP